MLGELRPLLSYFSKIKKEAKYKYTSATGDLMKKDSSAMYLCALGIDR